MNAEKHALHKRELELQRLMRQMKFDKLHQSQVYRNMEQELQKIKQHLSLVPDGGNGGNMNILANNQQK